MQPTILSHDMQLLRYGCCVRGTAGFLPCFLGSCCYSVETVPPPFRKNESVSVVHKGSQFGFIRLWSHLYKWSSNDIRWPRRSSGHQSYFMAVTIPQCPRINISVTFMYRWYGRYWSVHVIIFGFPTIKKQIKITMWMRRYLVSFSYCHHHCGFVAKLRSLPRVHLWKNLWSNPSLKVPPESVEHHKPWINWMDTPGSRITFVSWFWHNLRWNGRYFNTQFSDSRKGELLWRSFSKQVRCSLLCPDRFTLIAGKNSQQQLTLLYFQQFFSFRQTCSSSSTFFWQMSTASLNPFEWFWPSELTEKTHIALVEISRSSSVNFGKLHLDQPLLFTLPEGRSTQDRRYYLH